MITIPDYIYERSVVKQLHLKEKKESLFPGNGNEAALYRAEDASSVRATASFCLYLKREDAAEITEGSFTPIRRRLMCCGAGLSEIRAEIVFYGEFEETKLRNLSRTLSVTAEKMGANAVQVGVHREPHGDGSIMVLLTGDGGLRKISDAPWQRQELFPGEGIVITGSIGRAGSLTLLKENEKKMEAYFPPVFMDKLKRRVKDRLPFIEFDTSSFFGVTAMAGAEEGGLEAALWRLGERENFGLRIYADRLHFDQETIEITEFLDVNPLKLSSEGVYVMASTRAEDLTMSLRAAGLPAVLAGEVTKEKKRVIVFGDEERFLENPRW